VKGVGESDELNDASHSTTISLIYTPHFPNTNQRSKLSPHRILESQQVQPHPDHLGVKDKYSHDNLHLPKTFIFPQDQQTHKTQVRTPLTRIPLLVNSTSASRSYRCGVGKTDCRDQSGAVSLRTRGQNTQWPKEGGNVNQPTRSFV